MDCPKCNNACELKEIIALPNVSKYICKDCGLLYIRNVETNELEAVMKYKKE